MMNTIGLSDGTPVRSCNSIAQACGRKRVDESISRRPSRNLAPYGVRLALNILVERWLSRPTQQTIADGEANLRIEVAEILVVELHFIVVLARMERVEVGNAFDAQE
jgi:hypothetical protein